MDRDKNKVKELEAKNLALLEEIEEWKKATGLEKGGDPDGVTPEDARKYWESLVRVNTSPVLYWYHVPTAQDDGGWSHIESRPDHCQRPIICVMRMGGQAHAARVNITCQNSETKKRIIVADVIVPFRYDLVDCLFCMGKGWTVFRGEEMEECPWCLGDKQSAMDEAKEIACAIYWSWLRSPNGGGKCNNSPVNKK